ncbi:hypothetical protein VWM48_09870, partial [Campylobacter coli]
SGLRINSAADDASGMAIADSLRSQANTLGQAISNGNDALGILYIVGTFLAAACAVIASFMFPVELVLEGVQKAENTSPMHLN